MGNSIDPLSGRIVEIAVALHVPQLGVIRRGSPGEVFEQGEIGTQRDGISGPVVSVSQEQSKVVHCKRNGAWPRACFGIVYPKLLLDSVGDGILKVEVPGNIERFERFKLHVFEWTLAVHVDTYGRQVHSHFTCLYTLRMPQVG